MNNEGTEVTSTQVAAEVIANAAETAKNVIDQAADTAAKALVTEESISKALATALRDVFGENQNSGRFIDVTRIPLICKSIIDTNKRLENIEMKLDGKYVTNEAFFPVKSIVYGMVSLVLLAVAGAIVALVIRK